MSLTYNSSKTVQNNNKLKSEIVESLKSVLHYEGIESVIWEHQYDNQISNNAALLLELKKEKYLSILIEKYGSKPAVGEKIQWLGQASEFGLLINELEKNGYIKKSQHKRASAKETWAGTAKLLHAAFSIPNLTRDGETSEDNLRKEISSPTLSDKEHGFFQIKRMNHK